MWVCVVLFLIGLVAGVSLCWVACCAVVESGRSEIRVKGEQIKREIVSVRQDCEKLVAKKQEAERGRVNAERELEAIKCEAEFLRRGRTCYETALGKIQAAVEQAKKAEV